VPHKPPEPPDPPPVVTEIPVPETSPVTLDAPAIDAPRATGSFDAPRDLGIAPRPSAGRPKPNERDLVERHRAVFADAVARIARLQADILDLAHDQAPAEIEAAARRGAAVQRDLDSGLDELDTALLRACADLDTRAGALALRLEAEAADANTAIRSAAARAHGSVAAAITRLTAEKEAIGTKHWTPLVTLLDKQASDIRKAATTAIEKLRTVQEAAAAAYAGGATPLASAQNEEKLVRIPLRGRAEAREFEAARDYDVRAMEAKKPRVADAKTESMKPLDQKVEALHTEAPGAIARAQKDALHQLDKMVRSLHNALETGRTGAHVSLVNQHKSARTQLIASARQRMAAQQNEARSRLVGNQAAASGMAGGMPVAVRTLHEHLAAERERPAEQFAQVVINASTTLVKQMEAASPGRISHLRSSGSEGAAAQDAAAKAAGEGFRASVAGASQSIVRSSAQIGDQLEQQLTPALPGLAKLATPVVHSIDSFVRPLARSCKAAIERLAETADKLKNSLTVEYETGHPPVDAGGGEGAPAAPAPPAAGAQAASEPEPRLAGPTPAGFVARVTDIAVDPLGRDAALKELATAVDSKVSDDVETRAGELHNSLAASNVAATFVQLRGLTRLRGVAVETLYNSRGENLRSDIDSGLRKLLSSHYTDEANISAALAYLDGNAAEGARQEMQLAIHLWNDNERVKLAARGLTREQMIALGQTEAGRATLDDVRDDLNESTREVFEALRRGDTDTADALELRDQIDDARKKEGQKGADLVTDAIASASLSGPRGALAGADPLGLGLDRDRSLVDPDRYPDPAQHWQRVTDAFAGLRGVGPAPVDAHGAPDNAAVLVSYATRELDYVVETTDPSEGDQVGYDPNTGRYYKAVREGITGPNRDLISDLARHGEGSPEARASRMAVEMQRSGGPDVERLNTATYDPRMNPALAMDPRDPDAAKHAQAALEQAQREREQALAIYADRYAPGFRGNTKALRQLLAAQARIRTPGEPDRAAYAAAMVSQDRPDPVLALNYALHGESTRMDVLRRTMGSLRRDQLDEALKRYNAEADATGRPHLEDRLGLYGRSGGDITGDETQEIERLMLGVPVTDRERAEVAHLQARQQKEGTGGLGVALNTLGGEQARLDRSYEQLLTVMGVAPTDFDERGRLRVIDPTTGRTAGRFEPNGVFKPEGTATLDRLNAAMIGARLSAEGYKAATDRMASYITTALMVIAAVVTTALTGGAAAGFWAVALTATAVTLTAGVIGIGANYALKGSRYTAHEAEHDLAVAAVQAATAGVGAGLGAVLKGASIAAQAAGRAGPGLATEMAVGGITSAAGSAGQAAIDHRPIGDAFLRGLFGGGLGAAAARPFGKLLGNDAGLFEKAAVRAVTGTTSGAVSRAGEIAYDRSTGEDTRSLGEQIDDVRDASVMAGIQSGLEQGGEHFGEHHRERIAASHNATLASAAQHGAPHPTEVTPGRPTPPSPERPAPVREIPPPAPVPGPPEALDPHAPTRRAAAAEAEPRAPAERPAAVEPPPRPAIAPPAPEHPIRLPEIPAPARAPAAPVMAEGPHVAPTIRPPGPEAEARAPALAAPGREEPSAPPPGGRARAEEDVRAAHPVREGTASAVRESELFRGDTHVGVPGNEARVAARVESFSAAEASRFNFAPDPEHGLIMTLPGPPERRVAIRIEAAAASALPIEEGRRAVAAYTHEPGAGEIDATYHVKVSAGTDPDNIGPALAHEFGEIRTIEQALASGKPVGAEQARAGTAKALSAHDVGQVEQLRVRHGQIAEAEAQLRTLQPGSEAHDEAAARLRRFHQDSDALLTELGVLPKAGEPAAPGRADLIKAAPELDEAARAAVEARRTAAEERRGLALLNELQGQVLGARVEAEAHAPGSPAAEAATARSRAAQEQAEATLKKLGLVAAEPGGAAPRRLADIAPEIPPGVRDAVEARIGAAEDRRDLVALQKLHQDVVAAREAAVAAAPGSPERADAVKRLDTAQKAADALLVGMGMMPPQGELAAPGAVARQRRINANPGLEPAAIHALGFEVGDAINRRLPLEPQGEIGRRLARGDRTVSREEFREASRQQRRAQAALGELGSELAFAGAEPLPGVGVQKPLERPAEQIASMRAAARAAELADVRQRAQKLDAPRRARFDELLLLGGREAEQVLLASDETSRAKRLGAPELAAAAPVVPAGTPAAATLPGAAPAVGEPLTTPHPAAAATPRGPNLYDRLRQPIPMTPEQAGQLQALLSDRTNPMSDPDRRGRLARALSLAEAAATVARWQSQGMTPEEARQHLEAFGDLLSRRSGKGKGTGLDVQREAAAREAEAAARKPAIERIQDPTLKSFAQSNPEVGHLAATAGTKVLQERWEAYCGRAAEDGVPPTAEGFAKDVRRYRDAHLKPAFGESTAAFELGRSRRPDPSEPLTRADLFRDLQVLKGPIDVDPVTGQSKILPNVGGSDLVGVRPDGRVVYGDDKAVQKAIVGEVSAFTENLAANMTKDAAAFEAAFARQRALGLPIDPVHEQAAQRIKKCAAELSKLGPLTLDQIANNPAAFQKALHDAGIDLIVTSATGQARGVSADLEKIGVRFVK